jgi:uncharacterized damage-inducible protein DinB
MHIPTLSLQFQATLGVASRNLADVTHEESLIASPAGGNCLNWVVGHIVASRNNLLEVLGQERMWQREKDQVYERGSQAITDENARPLPELVEAYEKSQDAVLAGLQTITPDRLAEPAPFSPGDNPHETVGTLLTVFAFHEAYHVGQTGVLRRVSGHPGALG